MTLFNQWWTDHDGSAIGNVPSPKLVVHTDTPGLTLSEGQQGFVRNAYAKFCTSVATSCIPKGYHKQEYSAADGTKARMESINGTHRVQAWISGRGELSADPWFYQGFVQHPQSPAGGTGMRLFIPFTINKSVTKLKPLSPDFILSSFAPYVYDTKYLHGTETHTSTRQGVRPFRWRDGVWGYVYYMLDVGESFEEHQLFFDGKLLSAGSAFFSTAARYVEDPRYGKLLAVREEERFSGLNSFGADSYTRTFAIMRRDFASWHERIPFTQELLGDAETGDGYRLEIFDLSGAKIHTSNAVVSRYTFVAPPRDPFPPTPPWLRADTVWVKLRKGYYSSYPANSALLPGSTVAHFSGSTVAHFYEWGANEIRAQTAVAHDATGRVRPVIFLPREARGTLLFFSLAAYDQVLHGWREHSTAAHTLALNGTSPAPTRHITTIEALLQEAGVDPALASRVTISDLNMVSTDQSEEPLLPTWPPSS